MTLEQTSQTSPVAGIRSWLSTFLKTTGMFTFVGVNSYVVEISTIRVIPLSRYMFMSLSDIRWWRGQWEERPG